MQWTILVLYEYLTDFARHNEWRCTYYIVMNDDQVNFTSLLRLHHETTLVGNYKIIMNWKISSYANKMTFNYS